MPSAIIVHLRQLLARALRVGQYRPEYQRAQAEETARRRAFYAWRKDPPAFINQMKNVDEVVVWLREQITVATNEWPRVDGLDLLMRGVEQSRFGQELSPLIKDLRHYWADPLHRNDPLRSFARKA